ncbi:hypothetical protein [Morganella psychrotolerans]|uniref:Uncharacterized protein n=1 Tax=Morganella psychrotolerans TaxID=368603 RepID=A0A1B8HAZ6_9GAMM|nr:hypothetical protein [Morganella psychrotolerans]OBU06246.1 hypothetical protein AYY18_07065 [Morganella psychrotolerans]
MKALSQTELNNVSGGLVLLSSLTSSYGAAMGQAIGSVVDMTYKTVGLNTNFGLAAATLGSGIGNAVGLSPLKAVSGISQGVNQIINNVNILKVATQPA